jgi:phosphate transport system substrate-binding protein
MKIPLILFKRAAGLAAASLFLAAAGAAFGGSESGAVKQIRADGHTVAVDPAIANYVPGPPLSGDLHLVGGGGVGIEVENLMAAWAAIFQQAHPLVRIHLAIYTSGCAPSALAEERAEVGVMTRDVWPFEYTLFRNKKYRLQEIVAAGAAYDAFGFSKRQCIFVRKENPIRRLTLAQLDAIFSTTRKRGYKPVSTWGDLGLTGEWADKPIHLYGNIAQPDGNPYYFQLRVMQGGEWKSGVSPLREPTAMAGDKYAIGFGPANHAGGRSATGDWQPGELVDARTVDLSETETGPAYSDSFKNVLDRTYPLSRSTSLFVNRYPNKPIDPLAAEFVRVALSQEGQQAVARTIFLPLPAKAASASLRQIE